MPPGLEQPHRLAGARQTLPDRLGLHTARSGGCCNLALEAGLGGDLAGLHRLGELLVVAVVLFGVGL